MTWPRQWAWRWVRLRLRAPVRLLRRAQGAPSNDTNPHPGQGEVRDGLSTKIHLLGDSRCRPITMLTTAGHCHDSLAFELVMDMARVGAARPGTTTAPPRRTPGRQGLLVSGNSRTPPQPRHSGRPSRSRSTSRLAAGDAPPGAGYPVSTPRPTSNATSSNVQSTSSATPEQWPLDTTNETSS